MKQVGCVRWLPAACAYMPLNCRLSHSGVPMEQTYSYTCPTRVAIFPCLVHKVCLSDHDWINEQQGGSCPVIARDNFNP